MPYSLIVRWWAVTDRSILFPNIIPHSGEFWSIYKLVLLNPALCANKLAAIAIAAITVEAADEYQIPS